ncbi:S8 family serine peptidase [Neobacillus pocheonensis]|uniref:S8 family serine peptidase n=1 Tax=Neobacillus pocheonensis TaxID=363869 RepID=A0ABT0WGD3_9BACI|nr:S8 family serine peptidase [Neobacillus pocheonensis]
MYDIKPEVTAPGVSVYSTVPPYMHGADQIGNYQYAYDRLSGTSMATPQVSGVAALLKQAHPDMTPADIKATLMNTADPLNGDYSVYEVGGGVVDPYKAVHAQTEIEVHAKTETVTNTDSSSNGPTTLASKGIKTIKDDTGAISFGEQAVNGKDLKDSRSLTIYNHSYQDKTFNVQVKFQTLSSRFTNDSRADNDASANGVTLDVKPVVTVKKSSKANMDATITVPATAKLGTYEGYVVYTNKDNPDETYKIPFAIHTVQEGIDYVKGDPAAYTLPYEAGSNATRWSLGVDFKLKSHMRTFDFFLVDPKTNQEIGYLGTGDGMGADENINYYFRGVLNNGQYYPLTGDPDNPISFDFKETDPGLYKIRMVGTNDEGKTFTSDAPVYYGVKEPKVTMNYDAGQIVETANPTDKNVTVNGTAFDADIADMQAAGIDASQGDNMMTYYNPSNSAEKNIPVDGQGNFNATIPLATAGPFVLPITEYDFYDWDKSTVRNYGSTRDVYFVKKGTAYSSAISDKQRINMGDTTTVTFSMKNVTTNVKQAVYSFLYPTQYLDVVNAKPHGTYNGKLDVQYSSTPFNSTYSVMTITATATGDLANTGIVGDASLVDMTFKAKDSYYKGPMQFEDPTGASRFFKATYTNVDNSTVTTQGIQPYFYITPTYSLMRAQVQAEGLMTFSGPEPEMNQIDYNKAGTKISVTDADGKEYGVTDPLG